MFPKKKVPVSLIVLSVIALLIAIAVGIATSSPVMGLIFGVGGQVIAFLIHRVFVSDESFEDSDPPANLADDGTRLTGPDRH